MKLTKEKALRICRELWMWMYRIEAYSDEQKKLWPGWKRYGHMKHSCPCCEYHKRQKTCHSCLLIDLWPRDGYYGRGFCEIYSKSPYRSFNIGMGTQADSLKIVRGCEAALRKLGHKVPTYRPRRKRK